MQFLDHLYRTLFNFQPFGPEARLVYAKNAAVKASAAPEEEEEEKKEAEAEKEKKKKRIDEERENEEIFKHTRRTTQKIRETLAATGVGMESMRQTKEHSKFQHAYNAIRKISAEDTKNCDAIDTVLKGMAGKLPRAKIEEIRDLDWNRTADLPKILDGLKQYGIGQYEREQLRTLKRTEWKIEEKFTKAALAAQEVIGKAWEKVDREATRLHMMEIASRTSGINVREGTKIRWRSKGEVRGGKPMKDMEEAQISRIELVDGMNKDTHQVAPAFIVIHLSNGDQYPLGRFLRFVDYHDVEEACSTKEACEEAAGWKALGRTIEPGMEVAHFSYSRDSNGNLVRKKEIVHVENIVNGIVRLDKPVVFLKREENPALLLDEDILKKEFTLGEFAKWMRRHEAMPNITTLEDLNELLAAIAQYRNQKLSRDANLYPPIEPKAGSVLQVGPDPENLVKIDRVIGDRIQLSNGDKMTFPGFLVWVLENGVENANKDVRKKREQKELEKIGEAEPQAEEPQPIKEEKKEEKKPEEPPPPSAIASQEEGYFTDLWRQTNVMSLVDVWNFGKEIIEYIKRRHQRKSKGRYATVGQRLPGRLGNEFKRVFEEAQEEEVHKYMEPMKSMSVWEVEEILHHTSDKDQAKAALNVLAEKGHIRWDNRHLHKNLNRLVRWYTHRKDIRIPETEAEEDEFIKKTGMSSQDMIQLAVDALWGESSYAHWFNQNNSQYDTHMKEYNHKGQQLEGDPLGTGGLSGRMKQLLKLHRQGHYVDPHEYEGLIRFSIDAGKMTAEDKIYFLIAGITVKSPKTHETILSLDRFGVMDGNFLNRFPMLDMIVDKNTTHLTCADLLTEDRLEKDAQGNIIKGSRYRIKDFEKWMQEFERDEVAEGRPEAERKNAPGKNVTEFMWQRILPHQKTHIRNTKGLRNAHMIDHDDAHVIITQGSEQEVDQLTTSMGGAQTQFTFEGFMNAYPGWNQGFKSLMESTHFVKDEDRLYYTAKMLRNFIRLNGILTGRLYATETRRARLDRSHFEKRSVVDSNPVWVHRKALEDMIVAIGNAYGIRSPKGQSLGDTLFPNRDGASRQQGADKEDQQFLMGIGEVLENAVRQDNGQKLYAVIRNFIASNRLQGMEGPEYQTSYEAQKLRSQMKQESEVAQAAQPAAMGNMAEEMMSEVPEELS